MSTTTPTGKLQPPGIRFCSEALDVGRDLLPRLEELGLHRYVAMAGNGPVGFSLKEECAHAWVPRGDTTNLPRHLGLDSTDNPEDLQREIILTLLAGPRPYEFPNYAEFAAAVRIRCNIVGAARRTQLAFHTSEAERPSDYWTYTEGTGFTVNPGKPLVAALKKATQPEAAGKLYSFSCYRATEHVLLLALAQELASVNPPLLERLQAQWETRPIMSGKFHSVFLYEYGSMDNPLPPRYYVPGDRLWFRNPDERSSDVAGYEGSWVFYLGGGLFSNFWKRDQPYTLTTKCVEIFHWRHGAYQGEDGTTHIDEAVVEAKMRESLAKPEEIDRILRQMGRLRDPRGVYGGGCIDASREFPRRVCPGTADIALPQG